MKFLHRKDLTLTLALVVIISSMIIILYNHSSMISTLYMYTRSLDIG